MVAPPSLWFLNQRSSSEAVASGLHLNILYKQQDVLRAWRWNDKKEAMEAVNGAALVLPDGIGVVKGAAILETPLKGRVPGIEFAAGLMEKMAERASVDEEGGA